MKKLLILAAVAGIGYVAYRQWQARQPGEDLWSEATTEPDLR